jgi:hypothetical protein
MPKANSQIRDRDVPTIVSPSSRRFDFRLSLARMRCGAALAREIGISQVANVAALLSGLSELILSALKEMMTLTHNARPRITVDGRFSLEPGD